MRDWNAIYLMYMRPDMFKVLVERMHNQIEDYLRSLS